MYMKDIEFSSFLTHGLFLLNQNTGDISGLEEMRSWGEHIWIWKRNILLISSIYKTNSQMIKSFRWMFQKTGNNKITK